jgi:hypothetical protein
MQSRMQEIMIPLRTYSENSIDDRITTTYDINYGYLPQSLRKAAKGISIYF